MKISKINIKDVEYISTLGDSRYEFNISGSNIDYVILSTIRRIIMSEIPIYAFNEFIIEKNTSIFHNNYLKSRLEHMPVWGINNDVDFFVKLDENPIIDEVTNEINNFDDIDDIELNINQNIDSSTLNQLTMYINTKNKTNEIINVTTNDASFYYKKKQIENPYKTPILLLKLQPKQEIIFSAITKLGIELENTMYSPISITTYKQINDNEFNFIIESRGQIPEKRILYVSILNIEKKLNNLLKLINDQNIKNDETGEIIIYDEDHTLGNLISRGLQLHENILFAGYNLEHPLIRKLYIHYKIKKNSNIKNIIKDVVDYYINLYSQIKKHFI
jgi:DNA-directed RNA polymerase subunit L